MRSLFSIFKNQPIGTEDISVLINYCTNDYRFLRSCVSQASQIAGQVMVAYSDYFFDGVPENEYLISKSIAENPEAAFVFFPYQSALKKESQYWVTYARWQALQQAKGKYVLLLDADEIVDAPLFLSWLKKAEPGKYNILKLANYYYFREACFRAYDWEDSATLVRKDLLTEALVMDFEDRHKAFEALPEPKMRRVTGLNGKPMIHHFSWVRSKEEMLRKVKSWGHNEERNWPDLVEEEFSKPFSGTDFVHGYRYETVPKPFQFE